MISIVTGYYNRKELFHRTLKSISKSKIKDLELIAVDDGSLPDQRIEDLQIDFPFLKIIRLERENKWYINPCIPFNIGLREAKGDIIVLQNPECLHAHDILSYFVENLDDSVYMSASAYGLNPQLTNELPQYLESNTIGDLLQSLPQRAYIGGTALGWYNHSKYRPVHFHFCSAMTRANMAKLNGFDERFAHGIGYDDDEIIVRIKILGLKLMVIDDVSVIHQYHPSLWEGPNAGQLCEKNRLILHNNTYRENKFNANIIKLWSGN